MDFEIIDQGSIVTFAPLSDAARSWVADNVQIESWQWLGRRFGVDHRMAQGLIDAIEAEGFEVS